MILRVNEDIASYIKDFIKNQTDKTYLDLIPLDREKRIYVLRIGNDNSLMYYSTLCDLPTITEAMKSLDMTTFYKSCDVTQLMYVHNVKVELNGMDFSKFIKKKKWKFDPIKDDPDFINELYDRKKYKNRPDQSNSKASKNADSNTIDLVGLLNNAKGYAYSYVLRDGLTPAAKNVKNVRHK